MANFFFLNMVFLSLVFQVHLNVDVKKWHFIRVVFTFIKILAKVPLDNFYSCRKKIQIDLLLPIFVLIQNTSSKLAITICHLK